jgi:hypothetical protein
MTNARASAAESLLRDELLFEMMRVIDAHLRAVADRSLVGSAEVVNMLLDLRGLWLKVTMLDPTGISSELSIQTAPATTQGRPAQHP